MPDDHSEVVPLLPIPNRTVKRLSADDSAGSRVKVGHRQALTAPTSPASQPEVGLLVLDFRIPIWRNQPGADLDRMSIRIRSSAAKFIVAGAQLAQPS
jgi:hypothetical protein